MIEKIIRFSVNNRMMALAGTLVLAIAGWFAYIGLPIDAVPDITNVQVQVNTPATGKSPELVEKTITFPVENSLRALPGTEEVRSISRFGLSQVTVVFKEGTDLYRARQLVSERLQSTELEEGIVPQLGPIATGLGEIFHYALDTKTIAKNRDARLKQLMELRTIQEWQVKPRLLTVPGVTEINTVGGYPEQFYVLPDPKKMARFGISFSEILTALKENSTVTGGGYITQTAEQLLVQADGRYRTLDDIRKVPVKMLQNFQTVTVNDIARVRPDRELRTGAALHRGKETVLGTVIMLLGENSKAVAHDVSKKIDEIQKTLPKHITITPLYDRSELVEKTLGTVEKNLITGALLVIIILFLLAGNSRAAVITAITIPLSLLVTFILMRLTGIPGSLMSMGALDFGIIIDGAVIVVDACVREIQMRSGELKRDLTRREVEESVISATLGMRRAAGFGQLIIIVVFLPVFALTGIEGKMFTPMAATFCFAIAAAYFFSFTAIPAMAAQFLSGRRKKESSIIMKPVENFYLRIPLMAVRHSKKILITAFLIIIMGVGFFLNLGGEFIPRLNEGSMAIQAMRPVTISPEQAVRLQSITEKKILQFPEVRTVFSRLGTAEISTDPAGINHGDTIITLKPESQWPEINGKRRSNDDLARDMANKLTREIPGQRIMVSQPIELRFNELLEGIKSDIAVKIYGEDMEKLQVISNRIVELLEKIPGSGDVEADIRGKVPLMQIVPKMNVINRYGISKKTILDTVEIAVGGAHGASIYIDEKPFPVMVRLPDSSRKTIHVLKQIPVGVAEGFTVPLQEVAEIRIVDQFSYILRESSKRRSAVMINLRGRDTESYVDEARKLIEKELKLPEGYYLSWGGDFKNLKQARKRLFLIAPLSLLLIFIMVYSAFHSVSQTLLIFSGTAFAIAGGIFSLVIMGLPFSISAGIGFIALSGIAVLNGMVLINQLNRSREEGLSGIELITSGTLLRLRPVLMTALTDILGFLPMMIASGIGAEVQKPLATVVVGGIMTSTILTLVVLPVLYHKLYEEKIAS